MRLQCHQCRSSEIDATRPPPHCPKCGAWLGENGSKCIKSGSALWKPEPMAAPPYTPREDDDGVTLMICPQCRKNRVEDSNHCPGCGKFLGPPPPLSSRPLVGRGPCRYCRKPLPDTGPFCIECGVAIVNDGKTISLKKFFRK